MPPTPTTLIPTELGAFLGRPAADRLVFEKGVIELRHLVARSHSDADLPVRASDTAIGWMESEAGKKWFISEAGFLRVVAELEARTSGATPVIGVAAAAAILGMSRSTLDRMIRDLNPPDRPAQLGSRAWWASRDEVVAWFERVGAAGTARGADGAVVRKPRRGKAQEAPAGPVDFGAEGRKLTGR